MLSSSDAITPPRLTSPHLASVDCNPVVANKTQNICMIATHNSHTLAEAHYCSHEPLLIAGQQRVAPDPGVHHLRHLRPGGAPADPPPPLPRCLCGQVRSLTPGLTTDHYIVCCQDQGPAAGHGVSVHCGPGGPGPGISERRLPRGWGHGAAQRPGEERGQGRDRRHQGPGQHGLQHLQRRQQGPGLRADTHGQCWVRPGVVRIMSDCDNIYRNNRSHMMKYEEGVIPMASDRDDR